MFFQNVLSSITSYIWVTEVRKKVIEGITTGIAVVAVAFVLLAGFDAVFGQPRRGNGQFAPKRTTQFLNLLGLIGVVAIGLTVAMFL